MDPLKKALCQSRMFSSHLEKTSEEERHRIGQEVHHNLGGILTYLKLDLTRLRDGLMLEKVDSCRLQLKKKIDALVEAANGALVTVQRIGMELRPVVLEHYGLSVAMEWQATEFERKTGIRCNVKNNFQSRRFEQHREILIFRILQEALSNVARHAKATEVSIALISYDKHIILMIEDNGVGISPHTLNAGKCMGLIGMKERARLAGGVLSLGSHNGSGTVLKLTIPMKFPNASKVGKIVYQLSSHVVS
jgi:signal transduction histidine kinase